jgi:hypothetical protein
MYEYDSLLLWMEPADADYVAPSVVPSTTAADATKRTLPVPIKVPYTLSEPNALLLDQAEYALDDGEWQPKEEILILDNLCREKLGWIIRRQTIVQPWTLKEEPITHTIHLRYHIQSEIDCRGIQLAIEDAERVQIKWNGEEVANTVTGWYVDKSLKTVALPPLKKGENILEVSIPFGPHTNVEWAYLLGDFGVEVYGRFVHIVPAAKELAFGNITVQGLPFYGGNITYHVPVETKGGKLCIRSSYYKGAMQAVSVDGGNQLPVIYPPYTAELGAVEEGKHIVDLTLYGHRRNGFGAIHNADLEDHYISPRKWRTEGERWCYEYMIIEEGIMVAPEILEK